MEQINYYSKWIILFFSIFIMQCTPDLQKEIWIIPCSYKGTLTVYFKGNNAAEKRGRIYKFNKKGVAYSDYDPNQGFTPDFNQTLSIVMNCNGTPSRIPYYQDSLRAKKGEVYATYFLSGSNGLPCESILITVKR